MSAKCQGPAQQITADNGRCKPYLLVLGGERVRSDFVQCHDDPKALFVSQHGKREHALCLVSSLFVHKVREFLVLFGQRDSKAQKSRQAAVDIHTTDTFQCDFKGRCYADRLN